MKTTWAGSSGWLKPQHPYGVLRLFSFGGERMTHLLGLMLLILPAEPWEITAAVDVIEVNRVVSDCGDTRFTQVMWCDLGPGMCEVRGWRFLEPDHLPVGHECLFRHGGKVVSIYVADPEPYRSVTDFDPEVESRSIPKPEWQRPIGVGR